MLTLQTLESSILSGILNLENIIRSLGKMDATTLDDVVASAIKLLDLMVIRIARYKNVFPLPLGLSIKNAPSSWLKTFSNHMYIFVQDLVILWQQCHFHQQ